MLQRQYLHRVDSTGAELRRRWSSLPVTERGMVIRADRQLAGVGRRGAVWQSPEGGLWMTLGWRMEASIAHFAPVALVAGLTVSQAISRSAGVDPLLKWPNDLLLSGRKLAGILCEIESCVGVPFLMIGVGINGTNIFSGGGDFRHDPISLAEATGALIDLDRLENAVVEGLQSALIRFEAKGIGPFLAPMNERLAWRGERVCCQQPNDAGSTSIEGVLTGIGMDGALLLEVCGTEIHLKPGAVRHLSRCL